MKVKKSIGPWQSLQYMAEFYGLSVRTFQDWVTDDSKIPKDMKRKVGRDWRIHAEKYDRFLETGMV